MAKRSSRPKRKIKKVNWAARALIFVVITLLIVVGFFFEDKINRAVGLITDKAITTVKTPDGTVVESLDGSLKVHFIDVGQGDACIVQLPDERTMLIDAGENDAKVKTKLKDYIDDLNFDFFDFCIMTHSDADHIGGMAYVLNLYPARTVYRPNQIADYTDKAGNKYADPAFNGKEKRNRFWGDKQSAKNTVTYKNAIEAAYAATDEFAPEVIVTNPADDSQNTITGMANEYRIDFYSPLSPSYSDNNNYSPIMVLTYGGRRIALSGDAEKQNESEFVAAAAAGKGRYEVFNGDFNADVIKLGHHGSRTSSGEPYLNIMTAAAKRQDTLVVISCGTGNSYGHPHQEVLARLAALGFDQEHILRTDKAGDVVVAVKITNGEADVLYGETKLTTAPAVKVGAVTVSYREIAAAIFVLSFVILLLSPLMRKKKG